MKPIQLAKEIEERYRRYLKTSFYFRDPVLRTSFEAELDSGHLRKGPYLEATPIFQRGESARSLFGKLMSDELDEQFLRAIDLQLYRHQEESISRVFDGHNVVVATGTGSGKTEAFLYPILLHLYREFQAGRLCPGVRALVLYPMNALANDQRERLGKICNKLKVGNSPFQFTFGQYVGETPDNENDSARHARDHIANRCAGELVLRSEMRNEPPHILLTNYSMLEYLLLRPDDSPLFDNGRAQWWTFLVLDEAHQYRGAKGIEMAMLVRRLKQRLREGGRVRPFSCLATSATLVGGDGDRSAVAKFASDLFDAQFSDDDIILGSVEPITQSGMASLDREDYQVLTSALSRGPEALLRVPGISEKLQVESSATEDVASVVTALLTRDARSTKLRHLLTEGPSEVGNIADKVFADLAQSERVDALSEMVELLLGAKDTTSNAPLLSARYHLFLRSLEGAFLSLWPDRKVVLDRRRVSGTELFEIALCRECGQHYLVGTVLNNKLTESVRDPGRVDFGATFFLPTHNLPEEGEDADSVGSQTFRLCVVCGEVRRYSEELVCSHGHSILLQKQEGTEEREDQIPRCAVCGYQAPDPVREVVHGTDGPHAVIATTLYQELPEARKKILAFADGRQEAAFFAWYLEDSYKKILGRNLLFTTIQRQALHVSEGSSLRDLVTGLRDVFRDRKVYSTSTSELELRKQAWLTVYREFLTDEPRISLEGVGLARWLIKWPGWFVLPSLFHESPWSLSPLEVQDLIFILLDSMRTDRAVELHGDEAVRLDWTDLDLQAAQMSFRIGPPANQKSMRSWDGERGRRTRLLMKLLARLNPSIGDRAALDSAVSAARAIWESLRKCDQDAPSIRDHLLVQVGDARRLNPDWWRLAFIGEGISICRCETCGRIQSSSVRGICPRFRCPGTLKRILLKDLEPNHYRLIYRSELPGSLRVEEHTAQLDKEKAREFQRDFVDGKIHVLSCSTTFELGVDLGNLDTIFLRNVPPEAFNYAQRVGRSGRRSGFPGFAITFCRRGPHDLYHFSEPQRMLTGKVQPPVMVLRNERIVSRHIAAVALSFFFRAFVERFSKVENLFRDMTSPRAVSDLREFLLQNHSLIEDTLRHVVPKELFTPLGLSDSSWIDRIAGEDSRFALAEAEVSGDFNTVLSLEERARNVRDYQTAQWAQRRADTIAREEILSFLSRKAIIPKYGFPVDVVELDTQRTQKSQETFEVSLQRDLSIAISEFAPTSKLVANKKEWTSYGLKKVAEREWPKKRYARCATHNVFLQWKPGEGQPTLPCGDRLQAHTYVIPQFGFVTNRERPRDPQARPSKVFSTRPYFATSLSLTPEHISIPTGAPLVTLTRASPGLMVVLCEGRKGEGFYLCGSCGAGFRSRQKGHKTPLGQDCTGSLEQVSLGHEFVTDVLRMQFLNAPHTEIDIVPFAFSLAYAVVEGTAEVLEVPSGDLNTTVAHSDQGLLPPIILYDNVPGGAGLVARLEQETILRESLTVALKRVGGTCGCAEDTSCYGCLRSYRNQFAHQFLRRGVVKEYLTSVLAAWN